jgi:SAM-dependent methyltransferase
VTEETGWIERLDRRFYPGVSRNWDDGLLRECVLACATPLTTMLDLGAGAGIVGQMDFRGLVSKVCGVDLDPRVAENPFLDEARVARGEEIPYGDGVFDVVLSDNVLEHLNEPRKVFAEVHRVLRPGGRFCFKTPNKWHYMPMIARLTPHAFHRAVNQRRGRASEDTFPTRYRANSRRAVRQLALATGFEVEEFLLVEGRPEYLRLHPVTYLAGIAYERLVSSTPLLTGLRVVLIGVLRKPDVGG